MPLTQSAERYRGQMRRAKSSNAKLRAQLDDLLAPEPLADPIEPLADADAMVDALAAWCAEYLVTPPGHPLAGEPMELPDFIADFLRDALADGVTESLLCTARKNSKTAGLAMLVLGMLAGPLRQPGLRIGTVSISREKAGELLGQAGAIAEASELPGVEFMKTPTPGMIRTPDGSTAEFLSADKRAGHASGFSLVLIDELGLMTERDRDLIAGMRSSTSARGGRLIALSIRGESPLLEEMLDRADMPTCAVHHFAPDIPPNGDVDIHDPAIWAAGNPGIALGIKQVSYMHSEAARVERTPTDLSSFLAFDLNFPISPTRQMIFSVGDLRGCFVDELPEREGKCYLGCDFGEAVSGTAAVAIWPATGRVETWLAFGDIPSLVERGRHDATRYDLMQQRGELRTYDGLVTPVAEFLADVAKDLAGQRVAKLAADSYKDSEVKNFVRRAGLHWPLDLRRVGAGKAGSADVRAAQRLVLDKKLRLLENLSLTRAVENSAVRHDGNGNPALDKVSSRGRIDVLSAFVIACGLAEFTFDKPERHNRSMGVIR